MNRNKRLTIVTIISFFSLLLVGVYTAHAQDAPPKSGTDRGGAQTAVSVDPALPTDVTQVPRGDATPVPPRGGATQGPPDVHSDTRQERPPGQTRQTRPSGTQDTQPQSSSSSFPGPFSDVQSAIKVQPQNQVNTKSNTPCGSPKCLGEALTTQKPFTSQLDGIGKGQTQVLQQTKDKLNVQDLITGGKEKLKVGTSAITTGQTSPGESSISPKLKSKIFNQTNQTSAAGGSGTQKIQTQVFHQAKEKSNFQDSGSSGASSGSGQSHHHGRR